MNRIEIPSARIPNLAPMVDVIMVLLVFFLLGASINIVREGVLATQLDPTSGPSAGAGIEIDPTVRIVLEDVNHGSSVRISVMEETLPGDDFNTLRTYLDQRRRAGADPLNPVVIAAASNVRWRYVVAAMDAAVRAGFKNVQFAVSFN